MSTLTLEQQVRLKKQRDALARGDVIRDVDVKRRVWGATVDAPAMGIVIRSLELFGLLLVTCQDNCVLFMLRGINVLVI